MEWEFPTLPYKEKGQPQTGQGIQCKEMEYTLSFHNYICQIQQMTQ